MPTLRNNMVGVDQKVVTFVEMDFRQANRIIKECSSSQVYPTPRGPFEIRNCGGAIRILGRILGFALATTTFYGTAGTPGQQAKEFRGDVTYHVTIKYLLFLPEQYGQPEEKKWPLIMYLHGGSLRGENPERIKEAGAGIPGLVERDKAFPFIVLSPLCPTGEYWTDSEALISLLDQVIRNYAVDARRIYLTGHSMGGRGTWYLAYKHPERFAAIAPMSGLFLNKDWASHLSRIPIWAFQGAKDQFAPLADTASLVDAIKAEGNREVRFTILPNRDHFILDIYHKRALYSWMLKHRL